MRGQSWGGPSSRQTWASIDAGRRSGAATLAIIVLAAVLARVVSAISSCRVALPTNWQAAMAAAPSASIAADPDYPSGAPAFAVTSDGSSYFASQYSPTWSGITEVDAITQRATHVYKFPDGSADQVLSGGMDGRWLVWLDWNLDGQEELLAWDSSTGSSWTIAAPGSTLWDPGIFFSLDPASSSGRLAWTMTAALYKGGPAIPEVLHLYSLRSRRDTTVHRGPVGETFFWHNQLVFSISSGGHQHLLAASAASGRPVAVAKAVSETAVATADEVWDGQQGIAWVKYSAIGQSDSLWILGQGAERATRVLAGSGAGQPTSIFWTDGYLVWNYQTTLPDNGIPSLNTTAITSVASDSYITPPGAEADAVADGKAMVISWVTQLPAGKTASVWNSVVLHLDRLSRPAAC
jgi:hypothetical protein